MRTRGAGVLRGAVLAVASSFVSLAQADCTVSNETSVGARIEIGRKRLRVDPGAATQLKPGSFRLRAEDGRTTSGRCEGAERIQLLDEGRKLLLVIVRPA